MKDNKGFTLIELLAVILVLGIIALIAVSTISTSIKTAKIKSGEVSVIGLIKSFETKKVENEVTNKSELKAGYYLKNDLEDLKISGAKNFDNLLIEFGEDDLVSSGTFCANGLSYSYDGDNVIYQEYANFCNDKNSEKSSNAKLITGGYILDEEGDLYAIGTHNYLKYYDGVEGKVGSDKYKKVNTNGIKFKQVVSDGSSGYMGIGEDNKLYAWGNSGGLGLPDSYWVTVAIPTLVSDTIEFKEIELGYNSGLGIDISGQLYTWGFTCYGFGENSIQVESPVKILEGVNIVSIATFYDNNLALDETGDVYIWGRDTGALAGNGVQSSNYNAPTKVITGYNFKKLYSGICSKSTGYGTMYAIDKDGNLWGWGENNSSQIKKYEGQFVTTPQKITDNVKKVAANQGMLVVLKNDNSLYLAGSAKNMIDGVSEGLLKYQDNVKDISLYTSAVYYLDINNNFYSFGSNDGVGALGIGVSNYYYTPTKISFKVNGHLFSPNDYVIKNDGLYEYSYSDSKYNYIKDATNIKSLFGFGGGAYALKNDGTIEELACSNGYQSICDYFKSNIATKKIKYIDGSDFSAILLIDFSGNIYSTGTYYITNNLGYAANARYYYFKQLLSGKVFKSVNTNSSRGLALTTGNILYGWGENNKGQLANGNTTNQVTPIKISENIIDYYDNYMNLYAIDANNDLYYSGYIYEIGVNQTTLKKIDSDITFNKIYSDTVFGDINGYIYGYGSNINGELGIGNNIKLSEFTKLLGGKKVRDVLDLGDTYYYITENNELYVAGSNNYGILGLSNKITRQDTYKLLMKNVDTIVNRCSVGTTCSNPSIIINTLSGDSYMLGVNAWDKNIITTTKPISFSLYD